MLNRRELIKLGLYGGTGGLLHLTRLDSGILAWALDQKGGGTTGKGPMRRVKPGGPFGGLGETTMPIPPVAQPVAAFATAPPVAPGPSGVTFYDVTMALRQVQFFPGAATYFWGYNDTAQGNSINSAIRGHLGPTFVAKIGETTVVRMRNQLPSGATAIVHHHGGHTPSISDGSALWPQQIPNGGTKDYIYPNDDDISATHWYHDHDIDLTGHNVWFGLQGAFLLWDPTERAINLPGNPVTDGPVTVNGVQQAPFDVPIVIQDRQFDSNNQFVWDPFNHDGMLGDTFLINGANQPSMAVFNRRYRLRILNGCNCRFYTLSLSDPNVPMWVIGSDGGLRKNPVQVSSVSIGPAERIEVIVDFSKVTPSSNSQVYLRNCLAQTGGRGPDSLSNNCTNNVPGGDGVGGLMCFDVVFPWQGADNSFNPATHTVLRADQPILGPGGWDPNASGVVKRTWVFERSNGAWQINSKFFDPGPAPTGPPRIDAKVQHGATEIWTLINQGGGWYHPIHIHRNQFYMLDRNGSAANLEPHEVNSLKDVFVLGDNDVVRVITRYDGIVGDTSGLYVMHCHNVEHEDMRMMVAWQVCNPACG